jgi:putative hydrolase of the HAD superfamily
MAQGKTQGPQSAGQIFSEVTRFPGSPGAALPAILQGGEDSTRLLNTAMIDYILFDLDNTLYSARFGLEDNMGRRNIGYTARFLGLTEEEAKLERRRRIRFYGTTLEWLMGEKGFTDIEDYYTVVHPEGEEEGLIPDPGLRPLLEGLPVPLAILTNSPREHADRILKKLQIGDLFTHIFDMRWNHFKGKPASEAFYRALNALGSRPESTLFVDDFPPYVKGYLDLAGKGVLLDEFDSFPEYPHRRIRSLTELPALLETLSGPLLF